MKLILFILLNISLIISNILYCRWSLKYDKKFWGIKDDK